MVHGTTVELRDLVRGNPPPSAPALPLMHTTKTRHVPGVIRDGGLIPRQCPEFLEELAYLFYGRPAYRGRRKAGERKGMPIAPTCFILSFDAVGDPKRLYPFDTGGYPIYCTQVKGLLPRGAFELDAIKLEARKVPFLFFGDNTRYFNGKMLPPAMLRPMTATCAAASQYVVLQKQLRMARYDDRVFSVELQYDRPVPLNARTVDVVIIPRAKLDAKVDGKTIAAVIEQDWRATVLDYATWEWLEAVENHGSMMQQAARHLGIA